MAVFKIGSAKLSAKIVQNALTSISSSLRSEASISGSSPAELFASSGGRDTLLDRLDRGVFLILNFLGFLPLKIELKNNFSFYDMAIVSAFEPGFSFISGIFATFFFVRVSLGITITVLVAMLTLILFRCKILTPPI